MRALIIRNLDKKTEVYHIKHNHDLQESLKHYFTKVHSRIPPLIQDALNNGTDLFTAVQKSPFDDLGLELIILKQFTLY
jgi:hypothetical protein